MTQKDTQLLKALDSVAAYTAAGFPEDALELFYDNKWNTEAILVSTSSTPRKQLNRKLYAITGECEKKIEAIDTGDPLQDRFMSRKYEKLRNAVLDTVLAPYNLLKTTPELEKMFPNAGTDLHHD